MQSLIDQLIEVGDVISNERGHDLVSQAVSLGILKQQSASGVIELSLQHPVVDKTLLIVNRMGPARRQHLAFAQLGIRQLWFSS